MRLSSKQLIAAFSVVAALFIIGCGNTAPDTPETGTVTGVVTLDGKPLPKVTVTFQPDEGKPSFGATDENGKYELTYSADVKGAKIGNHTVRVTTRTEAPGEKELLPAKFHKDSKIKKEVKAGPNEINIELTK